MNMPYMESLKNPRIPGFQWQDPEDEFDRKMFKNILQFGCQIIAVEAGSNSVEFVYSVGLYLNFLHPEILIMGVSSQACHHAINKICREAAAQSMVEEGDQRSDLFEIPKPVKFTSVDKARYYDYLGYAAWFYRSLMFSSPPLEPKFPVLQALWPDNNLLYPDNPDCNPDVRKAQILLPTQPSTEPSS
jgi:Domain of unknown function (DUF4262)